VTVNGQRLAGGDNKVTPPDRETRVWDVPVRVFHWALVLLIVSQITTVSLGGNAMKYHLLGGYSILALVLFRIVWGVVGTRHARFANFLRGPLAVLRYARSLTGSDHEKHAGHNPLGGWSVIAMLASVLVQAVSGLFADDEIMTTGPLWKYVSDDVASTFGAIHEANALVLLTLICIHMGAILFYLVKKKENLIVPMFSGLKTSLDTRDVSLRPGQGMLRALIVLMICIGVTYAVVTF
jgi:cytochrome b